MNRFYRAQDWRGLEEAGTSLDALDRSRFNIIFSTTQKIILKRQRKENTAMDLLSGATGNTLTPTGVCALAADLYNFDQPEEEGELITNQRFEKLCRLEQLALQPANSITSPQNECTLAGVALLFSVVNFCCCDPALR